MNSIIKELFVYLSNKIYEKDIQQQLIPSQSYSLDSRDKLELIDNKIVITKKNNNQLIISYIYTSEYSCVALNFQYFKSINDQSEKCYPNEQSKQSDQNEMQITQCTHMYICTYTLIHTENVTFSRPIGNHILSYIQHNLAKYLE